MIALRDRMSDMFVRLLFVNLLILSALTSVNGNGNQFTRNIYKTPETIIANGYPAERHQVVTNDGYLLELHRIPSAKSRPIVFLMHGFLASSNNFISLGPEYGVAYNYADAGFDVWMGNARGTRNSRKHIRLNPDDSQERLKFFDFSFEEIGLYDLASSVEYILKLTKEDKLHYIGHSQGSTVFLVLTSMRPEYNKKFKSAHLMAPVGYQDHFPDKNMVALYTLTDIIYEMLVDRGVVELFPPEPNSEKGYNNTFELCVGNFNDEYLCKYMQHMFDKSKNDSVGGFEIGGAAVKQLAHFGQNVRDKAFRRWNFGLHQNIIKYQNSSPPIYDLSLITSNVTLHYTVADNILDERDVIAMAANMPNARVRKLQKENFLHRDFVMSRDAKNFITNYIINDISNLELWFSGNNDKINSGICNNCRKDTASQLLTLAAVDSGTKISINLLPLIFITLYTTSHFRSHSL